MPPFFPSNISQVAMALVIRLANFYHIEGKCLTQFSSIFPHLSLCLPFSESRRTLAIYLENMHSLCLRIHSENPLDFPPGNHIHRSHLFELGISGVVHFLPFSRTKSLPLAAIWVAPMRPKPGIIFNNDFLIR